MDRFQKYDDCVKIFTFKSYHDYIESIFLNTYQSYNSKL